MLISGPLEKAKLYIESHSRQKEFIGRRKCEKGPCITISRETGTGASIIIDKLVKILEDSKCENLPNWTIFDKNLIEKVIEDHSLPSTLSDLFDEKKHSSIMSFANEVLVNRPSIQSLVHKTTKTILSLAEIGNVIIVGRGGNIVTAGLSNAFHVRLISPLDERIKRVKLVHGFDDKRAAAFIKKEDSARKNYLSSYFNRKIDDLALYHVTLNTHNFGYENTAIALANLIMNKYPKCFKNYKQS